MIYMKKRVFILSLAMLVFSANLIAQNWVQNVLDQYKDSLPDYGIVALYSKNGQVNRGCAGFSHPGSAVRIDQKFCIGSCTKTFTAVVVLKLCEAKKLSLDDKMAQFFDPHPFIDSTITIRQLLNHTSGIADFTDDNTMVNDAFLNPRKRVSTNDVLAKLDTVDFEKGTRHAYSNTNFFLLKEIIEIATDRSWEDNIREHILQPLNMKNTLPFFSKSIENMAHPMLNGDDLHHFLKIRLNEICKGTGNIVSTADDMHLFLEALFIKKTLLSEASFEEMTHFFEFKKTKAGLGIFERKFGTHTFLGHSGSQISYIAYAFADPKTGRSMVVLCNNYYSEIFYKILEDLNRG